MDFSSWSHAELLQGIQDVKETLETYKDGNLNKAEQKNYEEMVQLLVALESAREEGVWVSKKPAQMTPAELEQAMQEIDEERKMFCRQRRGTKWSEEDERVYESMNAWAAAVFDEIRRRA